MNDDDLLGLLDDVAAAIAAALEGLDDWGLAGTRPGQYRSDLAADAAALDVIGGAGLGALSEESGLQGPMPLEGGMCVVLDPVDGSTNASRGIPWYATSLCVVDSAGARAALVVNLATGERVSALRGGGVQWTAATGAGARGEPRSAVPSGATVLSRSIVGLSGFPPASLGWRQFRALGAAALDLCAVACGRLDAYVDCSANAHGVWDYAAGMLICQEAGAAVADAHGRELVVLEHAARRTPVAAATSELLAELLAARDASIPEAGA